MDQKCKVIEKISLIYLVAILNELNGHFCGQDKNLVEHRRSSVYILGYKYIYTEAIYRPDIITITRWKK